MQRLAESWTSPVLVLAWLLSVALPGCRGSVGPAQVPTSSRPSPAVPASPSAWDGVHFVCRQWSPNAHDILIEETCTPAPQPPAHPASPALLAGDPPSVRPWQIPAVRYPQPLGFSGDGRWLALLGEDEGGRRLIYAVDGPEEAAVPLAPQAVMAEQRVDRGFSWAPVGHRFYLVDRSSHVWIGEAGARASRHVGEAGRQPPDARSFIGAATISVGAWSRDGNVVAWLDPQRRLAVYQPDEDTLAPAGTTADFFWLSPDGTAALLATADPDNGKMRYSLCATDGSRETEVLAGGPNLADWDLKWSPDGRWLALPVGDRYQGEGVVLCDTRGETRRQEDTLAPIAWRPDSTGVLCWADDSWAVLPVDGGDVSHVSAPPMERQRVLWPGAEHIAARSGQGTPVVLDLAALRALEFVAATAVSPEGVGPFSPDGTQLLAIGYVPPPQPGQREFHLCNLAAGTTKTISLDSLNTPRSGVSVLGAESWWSPDCRHILFIYRYVERQAPLPAWGWATVDVDTGDIARIPGYNDRTWIPVPIPRSGPNPDRSWRAPR